MLDLVVPTIVCITRVPKGPGETQIETEKLVGFLVDEKGCDQETPEVGRKLCLGSEKKESKPIFKTTDIVMVDTNPENTEWLCMTRDGTLYLVEAERHLQ